MSANIMSANIPCYDIQLVHLRDFLRMDVNGVIDLESTKALFMEIATASAKHGNHHILMDVRDIPPGGQLSVVDIWKIASSLEELGIGLHNRIAILNAPQDDFDRAAFLETCATNRGFNIRAFRDFEKALYWLAGDWTGPA
jgi:hypothetical protein